DRVIGKMKFESALVEVFVIEDAERPGQAAKRPNETELRSDAVNDETEPDVGRKRQTAFGFELHVGQRISRSKKGRVQDIAAVCRVGQVSYPVRRVETAPLELSRFLDVLRPGNDESSKRHIGACLIATQPTLLDQVVAKFAKSESGGVVSEVRPSEHAQPHI